MILICDAGMPESFNVLVKEISSENVNRINHFLKLKLKKIFLDTKKFIK